MDLADFAERYWTERGEILSQIFQEKTLSYREPERKGIPRGQLIGFSPQKFIAAFLTATGRGPQEIFNLLKSFNGPSYGTIKNWSTQEEFQKRVNEYQKEIANRFVDRLVSLSKTTDTTFWEGETQKVWAIFGRAEDYGRPLVGQIILRVVERINESKTILLLQTARVVLAAFFHNVARFSRTAKALDEQLDLFINIHLLARIYHKIMPPSTILHPSALERERLLNILKSHIIDLSVKSDLLHLKTGDELEKYISSIKIAPEKIE
jgi:hypothetical protein